MNGRVQRFIPLAGCYLLALAAGYAAVFMKLPLPWMIGPLLSTAAVNMLLRPVEVPVRTRPVGQMVVAVQVGLYVSADSLNAILNHGVAIVGVALTTILFGFMLSRLLQRMTGADPVTAFLSCLPGGPVEMGALAKRYGGDSGPVIFAQTLRISAIVVLIPMLLYYFSEDLSAVATNQGKRVSADINHLGLLCISLGAAATCALFYRLKINSPFFLGALAFSAAASATDLVPLSPYPHAVVAMAQILLGTWLGSTFNRDLFQRAGRLISGICITAALLIGGAAIVAICLAPLSGLHWPALVLGAAPGSVTEMALTAQFLQEDVALITAFHLARIFIILPNVPWMLALVCRRHLLPLSKDN